MTEFSLSGRVTRIDLSKLVLNKTFKTRRFNFVFGLILMLPVLVWADLFAHNYEIGYAEGTIIFLVTLLFHSVIAIFYTLTSHSQLSSYHSLIKVFLSDEGVYMSQICDGVTTSFGSEWQGIEKITIEKFLVIFQYGNQTGRINLYPTLFESSEQKQEVLAFIRQKAQEYAIPLVEE